MKRLFDKQSPLIAVHLWFVFLVEDHILHIVDDIRNASCAQPAATRMIFDVASGINLS